MTYVLRKTVGAWSAGTRVEIVDTNHEFGWLVRVLAGDEPLIEAAESDVIKLRDKFPKERGEDE